MILPLHKMALVALESTVCLNNKIKAILPPEFSISDFPLHLLADDFSQNALHKQPQNAGCLEPILAEYWSKILTGHANEDGVPLATCGGINRPRLDRWLEQYAECLSAATSVIILHISAFDGFSFKHQSHAGPHRTIFLLQNLLLSFVDPLSSNRNIDPHSDFGVLPAEPSRLMVLLISILLPLANSLRELKGQTLPFMNTHPWHSSRRLTVGLSPSALWLYNSEMANSSLITLTQKIFGFPLNGQIIRKMIYQVVNSQFPLLFTGKMHLRSPVDDLAQHLYSTGAKHYGIIRKFPPHKALTGTKAARHLVACEVWHALINAGPIMGYWRAMCSGSNIFTTEMHRGRALQMARRLVLHFYGVKYTSTAEKRVDLTKGLLSSKPFLRGISVSPTF